MKYIYKALMIFILLTLTFSIVVASEGEADWPNWRGANYDSKAQQADVFREGYGLKIVWKKKLGSGYSSISVANGHAVTMFSDSTFDYVVSLNANSGAEEWRVKIDSTYIGHSGSHNGPISTPIINDGKVYALGPKGHLLAINLDTGREVWSSNLLKDHKALAPFYGFATSPLIQGDVLVVETGGLNSTISGFNKNSGELIWSAGSDTVNYQSPIVINVDGESHLVCVGNKYLYGLNPQTGAMYWKYFHNGGAQSINPVLVGEKKLFFRTTGREGVLGQINKDGDSYKLEELWRTRQGSSRNNVSVLHDNHLYGFTGRFITSINAEDGKLAWKSRPPGAGFLIVVDGHMVIITREDGAIHIAKASPESYEEVASLDVLDGLTWTPPSFANGKIYARSLTHIAAIDIVPVDQPLAKADIQTEKRMWLPDTEFGKWVSKVEKANNKKKLIDAFMAKQKSFPVIEDKKYAHLIYRGEASDVAFAGDMIDANAEAPLNKIEGTDFYYASFELNSDARLNYRYNINFDQRNPDPLNKIQVPSIFGPMSQLAMPDWKRPTHFDTPTHEMRGTLDSLNFESKVLNNARTIKVYLPAGYANSKQRYPVVYVNSGTQAIQLANIPNTLDNLIGKTIEPVIAVFVDAPNSGQEYARGLRDQHAEMFATELVPMIDKKYRTIAKAESRAFIGGDEGGYAAIYTAFKHPGTFSMVGGQSTHLLAGNGGEEIFTLLDESKKLPMRFYLDWGTYDYRNAGGGFSWIDDNKKLVKLLEDKGYSWTGGEVSEGWGFASWRNRTDKILETFFPLKKTQK